MQQDISSAGVEPRASDRYRILDRIGEVLRTVPSRTAAAEALVRPRRRPRLFLWQERQVLAFIEENLGRRLRCQEVAATANLSVGHFTRLFRGSFGTTPMGFIKQQRVRRAQVLLATTTTPVAMVAGQCGFADQAHLSRTFAMVTGHTPAAWRRAQRALRVSPSRIEESLVFSTRLAGEASW